MKILIADDFAEFRNYFRSLLEEKVETVEIIEAENGREAIEAAETFQPDFIFMDITMPELNGIEAARVIHQAMPDCKIIILTVHMERTLVEMAFQAGASGYLIKNSADEELSSVMDAIRRNECFVSGEMNNKK